MKPAFEVSEFGKTKYGETARREKLLARLSQNSADGRA